MSKRFDDIARRKQALIEKAALERLELAVAYRRIRSPFDIGGKLFAIGRLLSSHPSAHRRPVEFFDRRLRQETTDFSPPVDEIRASASTVLPLWAKRRRRSWWHFGRR